MLQHIVERQQPPQEHVLAGRLAVAQVGDADGLVEPAAADPDQPGFRADGREGLFDGHPGREKTAQEAQRRHQAGVPPWERMKRPPCRQTKAIHSASALLQPRVLRGSSLPLRWAIMGRFESAVGLRCGSGRAAPFPLAPPPAVGTPLKDSGCEGAWKYSTPGAPARIKGREGAKAERVGLHRGDRAGSCQSPGARGRTKRGFGIAWPRRGVPAPELLYGRLAGTYLWNSMPGGSDKPREGRGGPGRR